MGGEPARGRPLRGKRNMKTKCTNCGTGYDVEVLAYDFENLDGFCAACGNCGADFDIGFDLSKTFIMDVAKMADFKVLSKAEFLQSYSYLTEEEYDATSLYYNWLMAAEN